jgi:hypothetical protein
VRKIWVSSLLVLLGSGCGGLGAGSPLAVAGDNLAEIRSGDITLRLVAATHAGAETGFAISGPFSMPEDDSLPEAELTIEQIGPQSGDPVLFISTGETAFVEIDGDAYELSPEQVNSLRGSSQPGDEGPFDGLDLDTWVTNPEVSEGDVVDGVETETIRGRLDVVAAANDLFSMARDFGGVVVSDIESEEAERLRNAVESATLEVVVGKNDGLLRRLDIDVDLSAAAPERLEPALSDLLGVGFELFLEIEDPNEDVDIEAPAN